METLRGRDGTDNAASRARSVGLDVREQTIESKDDLFEGRKWFIFDKILTTREWKIKNCRKETTTRT